ncbi:MAG: hypothetical protein WBO70_00860 [Erysipelotrichaceae bacterium]
MIIYYMIISAIIPFLLVLFVLNESVDKNKKITKELNKLFKIIMSVFQEKDFKEKYFFVYDRNVDIKTQINRVVLSIIGFVAVIVINGFDYFLMALLAGFVFFKIEYFIVNGKYNKLLDDCKNEFPYWIKTIILLCYSNPVHAALSKSLDYAPKLMQIKLSKLLSDIDNEPNSFKSYKIFTDSFNYVEDIEMIFRIIYRISGGNKDEGKKLLTSLNETVSNKVNNTRKNKNDRTNSAIGLIWIVPVLSLVLILCVMMLSSITMIT